MKNYTDAIAPGLVILIVPLVMNWMKGRAKEPPRNVAGVAWMEYMPAMKAIAVLAVVIMTCCCAAFFFVPDDKSRIGVLLLAAIFGAPGVPLFIETFLVRIGYDDETIYCRSGWRKKRCIDWKDVQSFAFSPSLGWWEIETRTSGTIRASTALRGLDEFLAELNRRGIGRTPPAISWMARFGKRPARCVAGVKWMEYGFLMKGFALLIAAVLAGLCVSLFYVTEERMAVLLLLFLVGGNGIPVIVAAFFSRIGYDEERIYCRSGWRRPRSVDWNDIVSFHYSHAIPTWVMESRTREKVCVSVLMCGAGELVAELKRRGIGQL